MDSATETKQDKIYRRQKAQKPQNQESLLRPIAAK
jgi:hypothetical protein